MIVDWPTIFAARILKRMPSFRAGTLSGAPLKPTEKPIGVYHNEQSSSTDAVLVTTEGVHVFREAGWDSIRFADIAAVDTIPDVKDGNDKLSVWSLRLEGTDGRTVELPLRGRRDQFRDAFEFMRFLRNVRDEIDARRPAKS